METFWNTQLNKVASKKNIKEDLSILRSPKRALEVNFPVKMDNGETKIFTGYRVQYSDARGPAKGGLRFHQDVNLEEVKILSFLMSLKCAIINIPLGGGKGGVVVNPKELSEAEIERVSREFMIGIANFIGPNIDVPAPDVNTNPKIMGYMLDEYEKIKGKCPGIITGKPIELGGSQGRYCSTSLGGAIVTRELAKKLNLEKSRVVIQGFGNAGYYVAKFLSEWGYKVLAVSDSKGAIYNSDGLDIEAVKKHKDKTRSVKDFPGTKNISNEELLELDTDILIPAALENAIHKDNADKIKAKMIVELANAPITPEADEILEKNNIVIIPDILANAGGVLVSYFEQVQNTYNYYWSEEEVNKKLEEFMINAFNDVYKENANLRTEAYYIAINRILASEKARGN